MANQGQIGKIRAIKKAGPGKPGPGRAYFYPFLHLFNLFDIPAALSEGPEAKQAELIQRS